MLWVSKYGKGYNISVTRLKYSANHSALHIFQKGGAESSNNNVQYVENNVFLTLKLCKHIALHQINKIMLFLGMPYDSFNIKQY